MDELEKPTTTPEDTSDIPKAAPDTAPEVPSAAAATTAPAQPAPTPTTVPDSTEPTPATPSAPPMAPATPPAAPTAHPVSAGLVILQWLTYAFWGWTVLALSFLVSMVYLSFISDSGSGSFTPYGIAAVLVLLPISFICDLFYSKREPQHKAGAEILVMVIHAVLFALFGIAALITSVFSVVQLLTSSSDSKNTMVILFSGLTIAVFYAITFVRTLNPAKLSWAKRWFKWIMLVAVGVLVVLGIVGPVAKERTLRNDHLIESELPSISSSVSTYAQEHNKLPASLNDLSSLSDDSKKLLKTNLVTYRPEGEEPQVTPYNDVTDYNDKYGTPGKIFRYQLCATYTKESGDDSYDYSSSYADDSGYSDYLYIYHHKAGNVCYKLKTQ